MDLRDRLRLFINYKGLNDTSFQKIVGLGNASVSKMGDNTRRSTLDKISNAFPELNIAWIRTGIGNMLNEAPIQESNVEPLGLAVHADRDLTIPVRFYEAEPTATFKEFCDGVNESPETINIIPEKSDHIDDLSCVFKVSGDSMAPQIQNGAKVLCREVAPSRWHNVRQGVIAIVYDDRFVIKRVKKNCLDRYGDNYILLSSDNPEYSGTEKAYLGNIRCIFEVIRVISQRVY
ncbi:MAG: helix-turn-helix transcriptional regulator [Clostridia bacterium]|nr:helix-turn-helix transcriptional regulator [Clostridia bacterium]